MIQCLHIREGKFVRPQSSWCRDARLLHLRLKGRMYGSTSTTSSVQTRRLLDDSLAVSHETSAIADNVMERLYGQRESLQTTQDRFGDMQNMTDNARLALRDMQRKAFLQKICLYSTIGILTILIILVAYREITNDGKLF